MVRILTASTVGKAKLPHAVEAVTIYKENAPDQNSPIGGQTIAILIPPTGEFLSGIAQCPLKFAADTWMATSIS